MERSTIITLKGEGISGVARLEQRRGSLYAVFSLRPQQTGRILAFLLCPGRTVEVPLVGLQCRLDEPLLVEGVLLARDLPEGLQFFAEGGALHARLNFARIREQLRLERLSVQRDPPVAEPKTEEIILPALPTVQAAPPETEDAFPPPEVSGRDDKSDRNALKRRLREQVPPGSAAVEGEEEDPTLPPPRSQALRNILQQARELYPANYTKQPSPRPAISTEHTTARGLKQSGPWEVEVQGLLRQQPLQRPAAQPQIRRIQNRQPQRPADGLRRAEPIFNPFPDAFPRSFWKKVIFPGTSRYYLEGEVLKGNARFLVHGIPGEYAPVPQQEYREFTKFLRASDGKGYWLRIRRK